MQLLVERSVRDDLRAWVGGRAGPARQCTGEGRAGEGGGGGRAHDS